MKQTLIIPGELPALNYIIDESKKYRLRYSDSKRQYTELVWSHARAVLKPFRNFPVNFRFDWHCSSRRKDKDNIAVGKKFILDGLIDARILPNDTWEYIGNFQDFFYVDRTKPRVVIVMTEQNAQYTEEEIMSEKPYRLQLGNHLVNLEELKKAKGNPPWGERVAVTDQMCGTVICQAPGHPNDKHYHIYDEWWLVLEGEIHWDIEGVDEPVRACTGDFVFVPKNHFHHIHVKGDKPAIRLAVSVAGEPHRHEK